MEVMEDTEVMEAVMSPVREAGEAGHIQRGE
jgi:hypothetical protein